MFTQELINDFLDGIDFDSVRHGDFLPVCEGVRVHVLLGRETIKVQVEEQTEDCGYFPRVIGEQVNVGTGDFEDDLRDCIWGAMMDANK